MQVSPLYMIKNDSDSLWTNLSFVLLKILISYSCGSQVLQVLQRVDWFRKDATSSSNDHPCSLVCWLMRTQFDSRRLCNVIRGSRKPQQWHHACTALRVLAKKSCWNTLTQIVSPTSLGMFFVMRNQTRGFLSHKIIHKCTHNRT